MLCERGHKTGPAISIKAGNGVARKGLGGVETGACVSHIFPESQYSVTGCRKCCCRIETFSYSLLISPVNKAAIYKCIREKKNFCVFIRSDYSKRIMR
jgi:hypothetical protein